MHDGYAKTAQCRRYIFSLKVLQYAGKLGKGYRYCCYSATLHNGKQTPAIKETG